MLGCIPSKAPIGLFHHYEDAVGNILEEHGN